MKTEIIQVENIKCGGCMNSIKEGLLKIVGVNTVEINKEDETIFANCSNELDRTLIIEKLNQMGYPEKGNNNSFAKMKSYVNCAIGKLKA